MQKKQRSAYSVDFREYLSRFICCLFPLFWAWLLVFRYFLPNYLEQSNLGRLKA